jgi:hypothetical protein
MHFPRRIEDEGSRMRKMDGLTCRLEQGGAGLITLRCVEVHAEPMLTAIGW